MAQSGHTNPPATPKHHYNDHMASPRELFSPAASHRRLSSGLTGELALDSRAACGDLLTAKMGSLSLTPYSSNSPTPVLLGHSRCQYGVAGSPLTHRRNSSVVVGNHLHEAQNILKAVAKGGLPDEMPIGSLTLLQQPPVAGVMKISNVSGHSCLQKHTSKAGTDSLFYHQARDTTIRGTPVSLELGSSRPHHNGAFNCKDNGLLCGICDTRRC